jgi:DNA adenine methylase
VSANLFKNEIITLDINYFNTMAKPFLKWVGGKSQLLAHIKPKIPTAISNYHEPFLGGGSVLLEVLSLRQQGDIKISGTIYASDANPSLIACYQNIQNHPLKIHEEITKLKDTYHNLKGAEVNRKPVNKSEALTSKESYYYWIRHQFNSLTDKTTPEASALFIFLNKTCFRGVYREGPHGFNVPYGHYKKTPHMISLSEIESLSNLFQGVVFKAQDFETSLSPCVSNPRQAGEPSDFIYLDPPYAPEKKDSFVGYTKDGFGLEKHLTLFQQITKLSENGVGFVLSNAEVDLVKDNLAQFNRQVVVAKRHIHSKNPSAKTTEVIIYN